MTIANGHDWFDVKTSGEEPPVFEKNLSGLIGRNLDAEVHWLSYTGVIHVIGPGVEPDDVRSLINDRYDNTSNDVRVKKRNDGRIVIIVERNND